MESACFCNSFVSQPKNQFLHSFLLHFPSVLNCLCSSFGVCPIGGHALFGSRSVSFPPSGPCEQRESVRRLRHSLGCFSTLVPWADKPPSPMQSLGLRAPHPANPNNPASWYSGLCPCLTGTVSTSTSLFITYPLIWTWMLYAWLCVITVMPKACFSLHCLLNFTFICRNSCWCTWFLFRKRLCTDIHLTFDLSVLHWFEFVVFKIFLNLLKKTKPSYFKKISWKKRKKKKVLPT